jgi:hypothetical protein
MDNDPTSASVHGCCRLVALRWRTLYRTCWALKPTNYMRASSENHRITLLRPVLNGRNTPMITVDTLS